MAIIVEDGTGKADAVSYADVTFARAYASDRGKASALPAKDADLEALLVQATDFVESFARRFQGTKLTEDQALQWPRYGVNVDGFSVSSSTLPAQLQKAVAQLAIDSDGGKKDLMPNGKGREVLRFKVEGATETVYAKQGSNNVQPKFTKAISLISVLFNSAGLQPTVSRG